MLMIRKFVQDEAGAVTIDWVAMAAGISMLGVAVVYAVFNNGTEPAISLINSHLGTLGLDINIGETPDINN